MERDGVPHSGPPSWLSAARARDAAAVTQLPLGGGGSAAAQRAQAAVEGLGLTGSQPSSKKYLGGTRSGRQARYLAVEPKGKAAEASWSAAIQVCWAGEFADTPAGQRALQLLTGAKAKHTNVNYESKMRIFLEFCGKQEPPVNPLTASLSDYISYVAWHLDRGGVRMTVKNFRPYLSCINRFRRDLRLDANAVGVALVDAVKSAGRRQERSDGDEPGRRLYLPAAVVFDILVAAEQHVERVLYDDDKEVLGLLRPLVSTISAFQWFDRPHTATGALWDDFGFALDGSEPRIAFFERHAKTQQEGALAARTVTIPVGEPRSPQWRVARLLLRFKNLKIKVCPELACSGARFWQIGADSSSAWSSAVQNAWLQQALEVVGAAPPAGFTWTAYSLRHGAASAAAAISCPGQKINHIGGWSRGSLTPVKTYINPSCPATPAAHFFFGFMLPATPTAEDMSRLSLGGI